MRKKVIRKQDLILETSMTSRYPQTICSRVIEAFQMVVANRLRFHRGIILRNFGRFSTHWAKERPARNVVGGLPIIIPAGFRVTLQFSKEIKCQSMAS